MSKITAPQDVSVENGPVLTPDVASNIGALPNPRARAAWGDRIAAVVYPLVTVIGLLVVWQVVCKVGNVDPFILPAPTEIFTELTDHFSVVFAPNLWPTASGVLLAFGLSAVIGISLGVIIAASRTAERCIYPLLVISQAVPKVAIAPLLIVWVGFGTLPKVILATLIAFFPIVLSTVTGLRSAPQELAYLGRTMGASRFQLFRKILFPNALPMIFTGLKLAVTLSVIGVVVAEFVGSNSGLGYLVLAASSQLNTTQLFASLFLLAGLGMVAFYSVVLLEKLVSPSASVDRPLAIGL